MAARVWTWGIDQWQHMNRDFDIIAYLPEHPMTDEQNERAALANEARLDAKAFRKNTVYDSEGDPIRLIANADRLDQYADRIEALEAEVKRLQEELRLIKRGEWFYLAGDMSSDRCRFSPYEVIDEDWLYDNRAEGSHVIQIEVATHLPDIWCAVRFFTDAEKEARQSDDEYELTEHDSEEAARAALGASHEHG